MSPIEYAFRFRAQADGYLHAFFTATTDDLKLLGQFLQSEGFKLYGVTTSCAKDKYEAFMTNRSLDDDRSATVKSLTSEDLANLVLALRPDGDECDIERMRRLVG